MVQPMEGLLIRWVQGKALAPSKCHICIVVSEGRGGEVVTIEEFGVELRGRREVDGWHC